MNENTFCIDLLSFLQKKENKPKMYPQHDNPERFYM